MKKTILFLICLSSFLIGHADVTKKVNVTAGGLSGALTSTELRIVTNLIVTGTIDARDFAFMRFNMPNLSILDLSTVTIQEFVGRDGTYSYKKTYPTNQIPDYATCSSEPNDYNPEHSNPLNKTLSSIKLPNSITSIGFGAFQGCKNLTSVIIPNSVTFIGTAAFNNCTKLTNVIIPESVTLIGDGAFENCEALTSVVIPNSVTKIGNRAFYVNPYLGYSKRGSSLVSVVIGNSVVLIGKQAFQDCTKLTNLIIPNSVTTIESNAFYGCNNLVSVTIGNSVALIGGSAFANCDKLVAVYSLNSNTPTLEDLCFGFDVNNGGTKDNRTLFVPISALDIYKADSRWISYFSVIKANPN
jgi:hypothetical protein